MCDNRLEMIIGIDIDEVLGDFITPFLKFHNEHYGPYLTYEDVADHDFETILNLPGEEVGRRITEFFATDDFKNLKPVDGAIEAVAKLGESNKLIVITGRPSFIADQTKSWLQKYFGGRLSEVYFTDVFLEVGHKDRREKYEFCLDHGVEVLIDDHAKFTVQCADQGVKVLLFDHPWNAKVENENITRVKNWEEVLENLSELSKVLTK